jgi:sigma-B regulation protein RsbU (phosphoserine phosphatase)
MASRLNHAVRNRLAAWGWPPRSRVVRLGCYLLMVTILLFLLQQILRLMKVGWGQSLGAWVGFLSVIVICLLGLAAFRWARQKLLWRLRNRLIVTYVFIGVIPAGLIVLLATFAFYLFAGQFSTFIVTSDIQSELRHLERVNAGAAQLIAGKVQRKEAGVGALLDDLRRGNEDRTSREVCAWLGDQPLATNCSFELKPFVKPPFREVVLDQSKLHLRAVSSATANGQPLRVASDLPLDRRMLESMATDLGRITLYAVSAVQKTQAQPAKSEGGTALSIKDKSSPGSGIVIRKGEQGYVVENADKQAMSEMMTAGTLPASPGRLDNEINFGALLSFRDWSTGETGYRALLLVQTRPSLLYGRLFTALGDFAYAVEILLLAIAILLGVIVLLALIIGTRLTRTMTKSVANLYLATQHVNRGDFSHRIEIKEHDQLAALQISFNSMTESVEKLMVEQREKQRLENELSIAQEVQAQLFPKQISQLETLEVHGFCRPARTVSGDYYDFLPVTSSKLGLAVGDISGKGISAALLMATIHSAVRAYILEGLPMLSNKNHQLFPGAEISPSAMMGLLNHQLFSTTPSEKYATLFLGLYDGVGRHLTYSNAGHLPPVLMAEDGAVRRLDAGGTVVGLFDGEKYEENTVDLKRGELFLAFSDGVTEPENDFGEFGEGRLVDLVRANRHLSLDRISEVVTNAVYEWIGANEQPDDVTLVLARAR